MITAVLLHTNDRIPVRLVPTTARLLGIQFQFALFSHVRQYRS